MKPPAFDYAAPASIAEVVALLSDHDGEARPLAGGQSLVPMLNFRLTEPSMLVDLRRVAGLSSIQIAAEGGLRIGAMTRTARLLDPDVAKAAPALSAAARFVAHPQVRSRGTVGGSLAHADPAAELPAAALLLGATMRIAGPNGERLVPAASFFKGMFTTDCAFDEILVGIDVPVSPAGAGWGFREYARRAGDFALAGVGVVVSMSGTVIGSSTIVVFAVGQTPIRVASTEAALVGKSPAQAARRAREALEAAIDPDDSMFGSGAWRKQIAGALFEQVLADAVGRAGRG